MTGKEEKQMAMNPNNLFAFNRSLPKPFDTVSKKVNVSSVYGDGTGATLSTSVIKGINAICGCFLGKTEGAVGMSGQHCIAEYKSSAGPDIFQLVVYNKSNGLVQASVYDRNTDMMENYAVGPSARDGAALMMALYPILMEDKEFQEKFEIYYNQYIVGLKDFDVALQAMAIMCDNAYRRIKDPSNPKHVKVNVDVSGNIMLLSRTNLEAEVFKPQTVSAGEFTIFAKTGRAKKIAIKSVEPSDFVGKYAFGERTFSAEEEALIPKLPDWYIIPPEVVTICKHAKSTTGRVTQMRNFLLRGCAGSGKTMGVKAIAAGLRLPYVKYTCSAGTEIFDFIGQVFPITGKDTSEEDGVSGTERQSLSGKFDYAAMAEKLRLPALDDIEYAPDRAYRELTGTIKEDATAQECIAALLQKVFTESAKSRGQNDREDVKQGFIYTETDFLKALKNGYVVEIQEPTTILQPGVLVGLNSLLEQDGTILLPTGEQIRRHPDAVVVVTTNVTYEGCRDMNQSVIDRMSLVMDVGLPPPEVMAERAMSVTGADDEYQVIQMVNVVNDMAAYCRKNSITDGTVGMRSLIDWIESSKVTGDPYESALHTIISKATADEEEREALITTVLEPIFARKPAA